MEGNVSQGRQLCPYPEKMGSQRLERGVDITCIQVCRAIQSFPMHHYSCKRAKNVPPSSKLRQLSHLKTWLTGNPRKRNGTNIHFTPIAYLERLPLSPGHSESLQVWSQWQPCLGKFSFSFPSPTAGYWDAQKAVLVYRALGVTLGA